MKLLFVDGSTNEIPLDTHPLRGRSTYLRYLPSELVKFGCEVSVLCNISEGRTLYGVTWLCPTDIAAIFSARWDYLIFLRGLQRDGMPEIMARHRIFVPRDNPHAGFIPDVNVIKSLKCVIHTSRFSKVRWGDYFTDLPLVQSRIIPNGVDKEIFYPVDIKERSPVILFFCNPDRGINLLPWIYEGIKAKVDYEVKMVALTDHATLHPQEAPTEGLDRYYESCRACGIEVRKPIAQRELADTLRHCAMTIAPSNYPEICSNAILQSLACGVPVIGTARLGFEGEVVDSSTLVPFYPHDGEIYLRYFVHKCLRLLDDGEYYEEVATKAPKHIISWEDVAQRWIYVLDEL